MISMEVFCYSKEKEFDEAMNAYHLDKCPKCSEIVEVEMEHIFVSVVDKTTESPRGGRHCCRAQCENA